MSLRDRQIQALQRILNLNEPVPNVDAENGEPAQPSADASAAWKVLVFDEAAKNLVSSVLRVKDLRAQGVTMHLHLDAKRSPLPDVPVIYLCEPNGKNVAAITQDLAGGLYTPAFINFVSPTPRLVLEEFGEQTVASGTAEHIASIHDQYLNFVITGEDSFNLGLRDTYYKLNSGKTSDDDIDALIDRIVGGLFDVVATMGVSPIIRCPKGGAAEDIAARLDRRLRDRHLNSKSSSAEKTSRPVLIIVDRSVDLTPMFSHSWFYENLIHDVFNIRLSQITMTVPVDKENPEKGTKKQTYDLTADDFFWNRNASMPFPNVAEDVTNEWTKYTEDAANVTKKSGMSLDDMSGENNQFAAQLKGAMALLPELRQRKATLEMHMNILEAVMEAIRKRHLDEYFQLEEDLQKLTSVQLLAIIKDQDKGSEPLDKLRLFIQWYLTTKEEIEREEYEKFVTALEAARADTTSLSYIKNVRQLARMSMLSAAPAQPVTGTSQIFGGISSLSSKFKEVGLGNFDVISAVKNLVPTNTDTTITKIAESIMDPNNASTSAIAKTGNALVRSSAPEYTDWAENYLFFDPRSANARGITQSRNQQQQPRGIDVSFGQRRQGFSEAIVFAVGGGSIDEQQNLQTWAKRQSGGTAGTGQKKRIVYGSTALYSANEFLTADLAELGRENK